MRTWKYLLPLFLVIVLFAIRGLTKRAVPEPPVSTTASPRVETRAAASSAADRPELSEFVALRDSLEEPPTAAAQRLAWRYYQGLNNAFFDKEVFLRELPQGGAPLIAPLRSSLLDTRPLLSLRAEVQISEEKPLEVRQRMAMLDLLGSLARRPGSQDGAIAREARVALGAIIASPWDRGLPDHVKRIALAERYDALIRLARGDGELAIRIAQGITPTALRERLHPALMDGLRASGMTSEEIEKRFANNPS